MIETIKYGKEPRPCLILPPWYPKWKPRRNLHSELGMMWVPRKGNLLREHNTGSVSPTGLLPGTSVTTGATATTKGAAAQIFASTSFDTYWVTVLAHGLGNAATASEGCLDLLLGAATEEVIIANMLMGYAGISTSTGGGRGPKRWDFPLYIPAGSRIAAQAASARTSFALRVWVFLFGGCGLPPYRLGGKITTYGIGTVPNGTTITPGASGAEGAWTEIAASTSEDHFALVPSFQVSGDTTINNLLQQVDLGIGAATEEQVAEGYWFFTEGGETMSGPEPSMPCFQDIPSGTRLVMRASNGGTNDGGYNGAIHAVS